MSLSEEAEFNVERRLLDAFATLTGVVAYQADHVYALKQELEKAKATLAAAENHWHGTREQLHDADKALKSLDAKRRGLEKELLETREEVRVLKEARETADVTIDNLTEALKHEQAKKKAKQK